MATNATQWVWVGASRRHTLRLEHNTISGAQNIWLNGDSLFSSGWRFKLTGTIQIPADDSSLELYLLADGAAAPCRSSLPHLPLFPFSLTPPPHLPFAIYARRPGAEWGTLSYKLTVNGLLVPPEEGGGQGGAGGGTARIAASPPAPRSAGAGAGARSPGSAHASSRWTVHTGSARTCAVEYIYATQDILVDDHKAAVEPEFVEEEWGGEAGVPCVSGVRYRLPLGSQEGQLTVLPSAPGRGPPECVLVVAGVICKAHG